MVRALGVLVVLAGAAAVICSVMIYHVTGRSFWHRRLTMQRFSGSAAVLGAATLLCLRPTGSVALVVGLLGAMKLVGDGLVLRHRCDVEWTDLRRSALLMTGPLIATTIARFVGGALGTLVLPALVTTAGTPAATAALVLCFAGELAERYLFFAAVSPARMPGSL
jgi:DMSO reductase anchor subunit